LYVLKTNLRSLNSKYLNWDYAHGIHLAVVLSLFQEKYGTGLIPSTWSITEPVGLTWGSNYYADPLLSSKKFNIIHYHPIARWEKFQRLYMQLSPETFDHIVRSIQVCWEGLRGHLNCGCCDKCFHTLLCLDLCEVEQPSSFPDKTHLTPTILERRKTISSDHKYYVDIFTSIHNAAKKMGKDNRPVMRALDQYLERSRKAIQKQEGYRKILLGRDTKLSDPSQNKKIFNFIKHPKRKVMKVYQNLFH